MLAHDMTTADCSEHSGIASAVNNDVARFGGLLAVAALPALARITGTAYLYPDALAAGFRTAVLTAGAACAAGGLLAALAITNPPRAPRPAGERPPAECLHCGLEATSASRPCGRRRRRCAGRSTRGPPRQAPTGRPTRASARA